MTIKINWLFVFVAFFGCAYGLVTDYECKQLLKHENEYIEQQKKDIANLQKQINHLLAARKGCTAKEEKKEDTVLGILNNNPMNVKTVPGGWKGQYGTDEFGHARFRTPEHGLRAAASVLINYYSKHKLDTIDGIIDRYCTKNQADYKKFLSQKLNWPEDKPFNVIERMPELLKFMARFETGHDWDEKLFIPYSALTMWENKR